VSTTRVPLRERLRRSRGGNGSGSLLPGTGHGRRRISLVESFNYAVEGIIHVLRTHRNMRIHFAAAAAVMILALWIGVDRIELVVLLLAIAFVLIAEMINSAIEAAIDVATSSFDPLAKLAKDIAAGAVLIAAVNAIAVGYLVFSGHVNESSTNFFDRLRDAPIKITLIALILVIIIVIATKAISGRGTPLRGGLPSGHAAIAFAAWMAVTLTLGPSEHRFFVSTMMFAVAVLVAHTRIETGIHSTLEVVYGGALGAGVTLVVFQLFF
jgi:diacylglycerol kinase (ATP)